MPTTSSRRWCIPHAIAYFMRQDYRRRELLIVDDGSQPVLDLIPPDPRVRYVRLERRMVLGAKRNLACELAGGVYIAHWDDDDWSASHRLSYQVGLLEQSGADICGIARQLYFDMRSGRGFLYEYPPQHGRWLAGSALCFRRSLWQRNPFAEVQIGEDTRFVWSSQARNAIVAADHTFHIAIIHSGNTSPKRTRSANWRPYSVQAVYALLGADLGVYLPTPTTTSNAPG